MSDLPETMFRTRDLDTGEEELTKVRFVPLVETCEDCGYAEGSFACKIRHLSINTGAAKAANDA
jgi:hypothetical protein